MQNRSIAGRCRPGPILSSWEARDGWPLRRMDWPQPKGAAARGNLLFASGRGDFIEKYLEAIGHWHAQGWNVTAFDWRGQGDSRGDIVGGHLDSFDPLVDDAAALIDDWLGERGGPHVAVAPFDGRAPAAAHARRAPSPRSTRRCW